MSVNKSTTTDAFKMPKTVCPGLAIFVKAFSRPSPRFDDAARAWLRTVVLLQEGRDGVAVDAQPGSIVGRELGVQRLALVRICEGTGKEKKGWKNQWPAGSISMVPCFACNCNFAR